MGRSVVLLNRFYWPDAAATGQMLTDLAEDLTQAGWKVTVIASRTRYALDRRVAPDDKRNGVRVLRAWSTGFGRRSLAGRVLDWVAYLASAFVRLLRAPRHDVIVAMSDPPFLVGLALMVGRFRGTPVVYWVQDLFPQIAGRLGVLTRNGITYRVLAALARRVNRSSDAVITLGPAMTRQAVRAGAPPDRTACVPNWADTAAIRPVPPEENPFVREHDLADRFVVLYSGNAGRAHRFEAVLEAARRLRAEEDILFLFIGGGAKLPELRAAVEADGLTNVRFTNYVPREELKYSLSAADVSLVTEDPAVVGHLVPSKTYGIMASGRPLLFVGSESSDVAAVVREHDCGVVVSPEDSDGLVAAIRRLRADPALGERMGGRGREAAVRLYDRKVATRRWRREVERLLGWSDPVPDAERVGSAL